MPQFIFANFVQTTLSATASTTDTSLSVTSATNIPALASGQQFPLTLINAATQSVYEIVYVTEVSGTTLTVLRGQEGTIAQSWSIGDLVKGSPTVGTTSPSPGTHYPVASETLPTTLGKLSVMPGTLTADVTLTLPGSGDAGSETTIYGSAAAYTTTVSTGVTTGSPYIEMPDGSQVYSYVIPASSPGAGIRIVWDGTNYRATTFGQTIVAPGTANNEAVQLGQFNISTNSANSSSTTSLPTSVSFTAPSKGVIICLINGYNSEASNSGTITGSGYTEIAGLINNNASTIVTGQIIGSVVAGAAVTVTGTITTSSTTAGSSNVILTVIFIPTV